MEPELSVTVQHPLALTGGMENGEWGRKHCKLSGVWNETVWWVEAGRSSIKKMSLREWKISILILSFFNGAGCHFQARRNVSKEWHAAPFNPRPLQVAQNQSSSCGALVHSMGDLPQGKVLSYCIQLLLYMLMSTLCLKKLLYYCHFCGLKQTDLNFSFP